MGLSIQNTETELRVRELAELTGESLTDAVDRAVRERLERIRLQDGAAPDRVRLADGRRLEALREIVRACQALPALDPRGTGALFDDLYDEAGLPR